MVYNLWKTHTVRSDVYSYLIFWVHGSQYYNTKVSEIPIAEIILQHKCFLTLWNVHHSSFVLCHCSKLITVLVIMFLLPDGSSV